MPGAFDRHGQFALLAGRAMGLAARQNLATLIKAHLETLDVLVIGHLVIGKNGLLAPSSTATAAWATGLTSIPRWARRTITSGACSEARSLLRSALGRLVRLLVIHITPKRFLVPMHNNLRMIARWAGRGHSPKVPEP